MEQDLRHELVPLRFATRLINSRVYGDALGASPSRLLGIANAVAALVPVYTYSDDGEIIRRLTDEEMVTGHFRKDGEELNFLNGRPVIKNLAVAQTSVEEVVRLLTSANSQPRMPEPLPPSDRETPE
jgi:hypothetical protein